MSSPIPWRPGCGALVAAPWSLVLVPGPGAAPWCGALYQVIKKKKEGSGNNGPESGAHCPLPSYVSSLGKPVRVPSSFIGDSAAADTAQAIDLCALRPPAVKWGSASHRNGTRVSSHHIVCGDWT